VAKIVKTQVEIEGKWHEREVLVEEETIGRWDADATLGVVGQPVERVDGIERTSGSARYTYDIQLPGMLTGKILRCPYPHARVVSIDTAHADSLPGVRCVLTRESDTTATWRGGAPLFSETLMFEGDEVAVVAADSERIAVDAISMIDVEYGELPFVVDPEIAARSYAPRVSDDGNLSGEPSRYERGDVEAGFASAEVTVERSYTTSAAMHNCLETHGSVAQWEGDHLTVWDSTQNIFGVRQAIADAFALPLNHVRVIKQYIGGGFGSKFGAGKYTILAAELSKRTRRPVKIMLSRHEENLVAGNRPPAAITVRLGAKKDGTLTAIEMRSRSAVGASGGAPSVAGPARELYACGNVRTVESGVRTNSGPSSAFRAPGFVEGTFALESTMDDLAFELGIDPVELRLKNYADRQQVRDLPYSGKHLDASYRAGMKAIGWERRNDAGRQSEREKTPRKRRGIGMASQIWGGGGAPPSYAIMRMNADGTFDVLTGTQDLGTGTKTVMCQIAAEELGIDTGRINVVVGDTLAGPYGIVSVGSLTVPSVGPAVRMAAAEVKAQIIDIASSLLDAAAEELDIVDGVISPRGSDEPALTVNQVAAKAGNYMIIGKGVRGPNPDTHNVNTFGAQFAEVEVDLETGAIDVIRIVAAHEFGRVLNPLTLSSQVEGGVIQGLGFGMFEGRIIDRNTGKVVNANLTDYKIPTALDVPDIDVDTRDEPDPIATSIGSKGAGEPPIIPTAAAIANAVFDATGLRITDLPITPATFLDTARRVDEAAQRGGNR